MAEKVVAEQARTVSEVIAGALGFLGVKASEDALGEHLGTLGMQLGSLQGVSQAVAEAVKANTQALDTNTWNRGGAESTAGSVGKTVLGAIGSGTGLSPLITGIAKLFGGGSAKTEPPALVRYSLPAPMSVQAGTSSGLPEAFAVEPMQGGVSRPVSVTGPSPQIHVNVQAMDSRSFLDHSADIAMAVRQAMLESSVLNDVIREA